MIFKLAILFTLNLMFNIYVYAESKISFVPKDIVFAKWGEHEGEIKLFVNIINDPWLRNVVWKVGFEELKVSDEGDIFINDVFGKTHKFDKNGKFVVAINHNFTSRTTMDIDENNNISIFAQNFLSNKNSKGKKIDNKGNLIENYSTPDGTIVDRIISKDGEIFTASNKKIAGEKKPSQVKIKKRKHLPDIKLKHIDSFYVEISSYQGSYLKYATYEISGLKTLNPESPDETIIEIPGGKDILDMNIYYLLGADYKDRLFLLADKRVDKIKSKHGVIMVDKTGSFSYVEMKEDNFIKNYWDEDYKKFDIDAYGNIYQIWSNKKGVYVTKWELIEK